MPPVSVDSSHGDEPAHEVRTATTDECVDDGGGGEDEDEDYKEEEEDDDDDDGDDEDGDSTTTTFAKSMGRMTMMMALLLKPKPKMMRSKMRRRPGGQAQEWHLQTSCHQCWPCQCSKTVRINNSVMMTRMSMLVMRHIFDWNCEYLSRNWFLSTP